MSDGLTPRIPTGNEGLDQILHGGLPANRMYLVQGDPGVGKTTLALQFLLTGASAGDRVLYVTLSETRAELAGVAASHGWTLDGIDVFEMSAGDGGVPPDENTLYLPSEVELGGRMAALLAEVDRVQPRRLVLDSCTELRLLAQTPLRFRRQVLALKDALVKRSCTVLLLETPVARGGDAMLQSLVHGVLEMEQLSPLYGAERRRARVVKMREVKFRGGYHDLKIERGGLQVFPRLVASEHPGGFEAATVPSGIPELDRVLGGGLERGSCALLLGPAGAGKSTLATRYALSAVERGDAASIYVFDEGERTLRARSAALGMALEERVASGQLALRQIDPAELSPGEFISAIRHDVEHRHIRVIVIDSLNGYLNAMPEEQFVLIQLHEVLTYLRQHGVLAILALAQHGVVGPSLSAALDVSYLADTVLVLRYFEAAGRLRKAISAVKNRGGGHEDTIRELALGPEGIRVGPPLVEFQGVLSGVPSFVGDPGRLLERP